MNGRKSGIESEKSWLIVILPFFFIFFLADFSPCIQKFLLSFIFTFLYYPWSLFVISMYFFFFSIYICIYSFLLWFSFFFCLNFFPPCSKVCFFFLFFVSHFQSSLLQVVSSILSSLSPHHAFSLPDT